MRAYAAWRVARDAAVLRHPDAGRLIDTAIELSLTTGFRIGELYCRTFRAVYWVEAGRVSEALTELVDVARTWRFAADRRAWSTLREIAMVCAEHDNAEAAALLLGKLRALRFPVYPGIQDSAQDEHLEQTLTETLGPERLADLMSQGSQLDDDAAFALADTPTPP